MQTWTYPALFDPHDGEVVVTFRDFLEAITGAVTMDEARALAQDALEEVVLAYLAQGRSVPAPSPALDHEENVVLDPKTAARAAVQRLMSAQGLSRRALAERMHKDEKVVRRILDGRGGVTMDNVVEALRAMGATPALAV